MEYNKGNIEISWGDTHLEGFSEELVITGQPPKSWFKIIDLSELNQSHPEYSETLVRIDAFDANKLKEFSFKLEKDSDSHKYLQDNPNASISIDY